VPSDGGSAHSLAPGVDYLQLSTRELAQRVRTRASCASAIEDVGKTRNTVLADVEEVDHTGPVYLNSDVRPTKVLISYPSTATHADLVYLPIWKCATSTVTDALHGEERVLHGPHDDLASAEGKVVLENRSFFHLEGPISASAEYDRAVAGDAVMFTVVREPFTRFVSAYEPILPLKLCDGEPCASTLDDMARVAQLLHNDTRFRRGGYEHLLSQTYFLSATDARAQRLTDTSAFQHVARVEQLTDDLSVITQAAGVHVRSSSVLLASPDLKCQNCHPTDAIEKYKAALLQRPDAACLVCDAYAQDYDCLGYTKPEACLKCGAAN